MIVRPIIFPLLAVALLVSACGTVHQQQAQSASPEFDWGFIRFSEVRAFTINWEDQYSFDGLVLNKNRLNPTRQPKDGILLDWAQVASLREAVTGTHPDHLRAMCIYPHHAFAFYDEKGKIIASLDVCFLCSNYIASPSGFAKNWDLQSVAKLLSALGLPLKNEKWD